jgi:cytochrome c biogenesis protein
MHQSALIRLAAPLASLRLTAAAMAALFATVFLAYALTLADSGWIVPPLVVLALNLCAAIMVNRRIRGSPGLIAFHVALLAICLLAGAGILTRMHGRVEVVEGTAFDPSEVQIVEQGIWRNVDVPRSAFVQGPVEVDFTSGLLRQHTRSSVAVPLDGGMPESELSDTHPLKIAGYRFSPTSNKGYALLLTWRDDAGGETTGAVHMPSFPALEWKQEQGWRTPAGEDVLFTLKPPLRPAGEASWTLRGDGAAAEVAVILQDRPTILRPGEWQRLRGGALRLESVRLWLGYRIDREPLIGWMLLVAILGIAGLSLHFYRRLWSPATRSRADEEGDAHPVVARG